jgi:NADPH2:quinone reductase
VIAGVVERTGAGVTRFKPGDRVWCNNQGVDGPQGSFAELAAVREDLLYALILSTSSPWRRSLIPA